MFFLSSLFFTVKCHWRWNVNNFWPLKNNALLCRDGTIPVLPTPLSFCYGLLINLFVTDRRASKVSTKHTLRVILSSAWLEPLPLSPPVIVKLISWYLFMLIGSVGTWVHLCVVPNLLLIGQVLSHVLGISGYFESCGAHQGSTVLSRSKHVSHTCL